MLDLFGSVRSIFATFCVAAAVVSPVVVSNGGFTKSNQKTGSNSVQTEQVVAGGFSFDKPVAWGRLGAEAAASANGGEDVGTAVAGLCPNGALGARCVDNLQLVFLAYDGKKGKLPLLTSFSEQLDKTLAKRIHGFHKVASETKPSADGTRWLRYEFTSNNGSEILAVYRHTDGSGVVAVMLGSESKLKALKPSLDTFLASGVEAS